MKIAFRVDASLSIGSGHVVRCLTLADALRKKRAHCVFITKAHHGNLIELIKSRSFDVFVIPGEPDSSEEYIQNEKFWLGGTQRDDALKSIELCKTNNFAPDVLITDHYSLDDSWEKIFQCHFPEAKIIVIDDLCNRKHECYLLIDSTLERQSAEYKPFVSSECILLTGTDYALLREDFAQLRSLAVEKRKNTSSPRKVLITMGGVDINNITGALLKKISNSIDTQIELITVVLGANCPHKDEIKRIAKECKYDVEVLININNMPQVMLENDIAIGALGSTTWERAVLGLPTINLAIAENQLVIVEKLMDKGFIVFSNTEFSEEDLSSAWRKLHGEYQDLVARSFALCDGAGLQRVVTSLCKM
ncbi:UDP-2,4-diacetamido-2,4,6-trideoxy-beta-L-altropyranose hydrolase [Enterobacter cloacae subsp. cloacae]|uniref:UDP-2,4-diacetamido-2,4, 6-trideoxy-beta-L-altropyranose hydrolase n=1 Tax=Enterobacter cloacae TaxID=550 RepID=UPI001C5BBFC6|nr:UDP-2,4-diacetamido-2,4,6-trideoxy-beta-L-altropyranose hydrolase [Enterobacter cloacae]MBW4201613.1 UDP-2,4-diacetamido-2,4,6-trideoxy-beta-L-altropyranose hydrolase [Enterobacter cloacae subsp. cloacae]HCM9256296.1 UDP-2,4-diacetamido-2,4,6-trideoxy-beta-L-altropyranose hydrolase [Enterobacter cloacae subsp. dissolvens]HDT0661457.1 UDP-2,4-diacetamido-2,4,6-trideoxy-beta-L-altropyranose hydrolase [Enterobacter cloacae subsp. dissolvens]